MKKSLPAPHAGSAPRHSRLCLEVLCAGGLAGTLPVSRIMALVWDGQAAYVAATVALLVTVVALGIVAFVWRDDLAVVLDDPSAHGSLGAGVLYVLGVGAYLAALHIPAIPLQIGLGAFSGFGCVAGLALCARVMVRPTMGGNMASCALALGMGTCLAWAMSGLGDGARTAAQLVVAAVSAAGLVWVTKPKIAPRPPSAAADGSSVSTAAAGGVAATLDGTRATGCTEGGAEEGNAAQGAPDRRPGRGEDRPPHKNVATPSMRDYSPDGASTPGPLARFFSVAAVPLIGLVAFAMLVKSGAGSGAVRPQLLGMDEEAALFVLASAVLLGVGLAVRRGPVMAVVNHVVVPVSVIVLLVLQSFPAGSAVNALWPPVAVFVTAFAAQFAVAVVLALVGSGELALLEALLPLIVLYAMARVAGVVLDVGLAGAPDAYAIYPVVMTVLLTAMLLAVILQIRRQLFSMVDDVPGIPLESAAAGNGETGIAHIAASVAAPVEGEAADAQGDGRPSPRNRISDAASMPVSAPRTTGMSASYQAGSPAALSADLGGYDAPPSGTASMAAALERTARSLAARYALTLRETDVLRLLLRGYSSLAIAAELVISDNTVRTHMKAIYRKLGVASRDALMALAAGE